MAGGTPWNAETNPPPKGGRPPGVPNKFTADMRRAALIAATSDEDGDDEDSKLASFYRRMKRERPDNFDRALERLLPREIKGDLSVTSFAATAALAASYDQDAIDAANAVMARKRAASEPREAT